MTGIASEEVLRRLEAKVASEAVASARDLDLEAEGVEPAEVDESLIGEWADEWFHNSGVLALEFALGVEGLVLTDAAMRETVYGRMRRAFVRAFTEAMLQRLEEAA